MARVVIVCGYDRFADIHEYSGRVAAQLRADAFDAVVLTGGFTQAASAVSEAAMMERVFAVALPGAVLVLEDRAMTTLDNLVHSRDLVHDRFGRGHEYEVWCDHVHHTKVVVLSRLVLGRRAIVRSVSRRVEWPIIVLEPFSMVIESAGALVPPLRRLISRCAARMKGVSGGSRSIRREAA